MAETPKLGLARGVLTSLGTMLAQTNSDFNTQSLHAPKTGGDGQQDSHRMNVPFFICKMGTIPTPDFTAIMRCCSFDFRKLAEHPQHISSSFNRGKTL